MKCLNKDCSYSDLKKIAIKLLEVVSDKTLLRSNNAEILVKSHLESAILYLDKLGDDDASLQQRH